MECLLELLRGRGFANPCNKEELRAALALAEEEHVLPWAAAQLRARGDELSPAIANQVAEIEREAALAAFYWCSELKGVLRAFAERGVVVVPLKGPSLAERIYGSAALRPSRDLDLLVAETDWARAEEVLSTSEFAPSREADDYHRAWQRQTTKLELHYDVENPLAFNFHVAGALQRAQPAVFQGEACWQFAPEDELLFLCLHAARHRYERLGLVLDLTLAFEKLTNGASDWRPRDEVADLNGLLALGLTMAWKLQPDLRVGVRFEVATSEQEHLERLAERVWQRLMNEPFEQRDWRAAHTFYLEMEPTARRRMRRRARHARILLARTIDRDYLFAARFGLKREWQVRMLRPMRLLAERMRS